jgi:SpoVK/Ycf46/Vps4 family AAA+-type ATPase
MDKMVTKYMGETSAKLRQIFNLISERRGVYLFDEFDAIGAERSLDNDVGEMRRVLNAFLQFIENDKSDSIIIAATNNPKILDQALFRRFDDVLYYELPKEEEIKLLILNRLGQFKPKELFFENIAKYALNLSHAEISLACEDAIKEAILDDKDLVTSDLLQIMLDNRKAVYKNNQKE